VGSIRYYPNKDALGFFCREVAPLIRGRSHDPFEIRCVSSGAPRDWRTIPETPELRRLRPDSDLAHEYDRASAVVVPIRAGGGTRIKVLEAFSHRRPVVSTSIGVEGLDVRAGAHVLIGDSPEAFADHCVALMQDAGLRDGLADSAFELVSTSYGVDAVIRGFDASANLPTASRSA
jgi:glycosyltransferase involved in cell wall biosynthesis